MRPVSEAELAADRLLKATRELQMLLSANPLTSDQTRMDRIRAAISKADQEIGALKQAYAIPEEPAPDTGPATLRIVAGRKPQK